MITQNRITRFRSFGKILPLLLAVGMLAGCARRYDMILTNGGKLANIRKPVRSKDGSYYSFVDGLGRTNFVPVARVVEIHPAEKSTFVSPQGQ